MSNFIKNYAVYIILVILVLVGGYFLVRKNNTTTSPTASITLYYGDTCPHCTVVDKYIQDNNVAQKIMFDKKEVFNNPASSMEMAEKYKLCGLPTDQLFVPFLYDTQTKQCFSGQEDIINYFAAKL
jgi:hypothetical protein